MILEQIKIMIAALREQAYKEREIEDEEGFEDARNSEILFAKSNVLSLISTPYTKKDIIWNIQLLVGKNDMLTDFDINGGEGGFNLGTRSLTMVECLCYDSIDVGLYVNGSSESIEEDNIPLTELTGLELRKYWEFLKSHMLFYKVDSTSNGGISKYYMSFIEDSFEFGGWLEDNLDANDDFLLKIDNIERVDEKTFLEFNKLVFKSAW